MSRFLTLLTIVLCLFTTSAMAEGPVRLSDDLPTGSSGVQRAWISPDSQTVAMVGDLTTAGIYELYLTGIGGGVNTRIHQPFSAGGFVSSSPVHLAFSPDSSMVFYLADPVGAGPLELYAGPANFSAWPEKISLTMSVTDGNVVQFAPRPDNTSAVYLACPNDLGSFELFRGYFTGGATGFLLRVSPDLTDDRTVTGFKLSPDGTRVIYQADQDTDEVYELYSAPSDGFLSHESWAGTKISTALTGGGQVSGFFDITPDSNHVIYVADSNGDGVNEVWKVGITGGSASQIGPAVTSGSGAVPGSVQITPDGSRVLFRSQYDGVPQKLVAVDTTYWGYFILTPSLPAYATVHDFAISPDSQWVAYRADADTDGLVEIWAKRMDNVTPPFKLNPALSGARSVTSYAIGANNRVTFLADPGIVSDYRVFAAPSWGGGAKALLPDPVGTFFAKPDLSLAHSGYLALFLGDENASIKIDLWAGCTSGLTPPMRLNNPLPDNREVTQFWIAPDESRVVYIADGTVKYEWELYSTELPTAGFDAGYLMGLLP